jgi:Raf kinase inhibitor-like YbhB/YbcL family protein
MPFLALSAAIVSTGCGHPVTASHTLGTVETAVRMEVTSSAFRSGDEIPPTYTCDGGKLSPPLGWSGTPPNTQSIAMIVTDPDAPQGTYVHWVLANLSSDATALSPGVPAAPQGPVGSMQGTNSSGKVGYTPPCPPSGTHHYQFTVYAVDKQLKLDSSATRDILLKAMAGHIIGRGQLVGLVTAY